MASDPSAPDAASLPCYDCCDICGTTCQCECHKRALFDMNRRTPPRAPDGGQGYARKTTDAERDLLLSRARLPNDAARIRTTELPQVVGDIVRDLLACEHSLAAALRERDKWHGKCSKLVTDFAGIVTTRYAALREVERMRGELADVKASYDYLLRVIGKYLDDRLHIQGLTPGDRVTYAADEIERLRSQLAQRDAELARAVEIAEWAMGYVRVPIGSVAGAEQREHIAALMRIRSTPAWIASKSSLAARGKEQAGPGGVDLQAAGADVAGFDSPSSALPLVQPASLTPVVAEIDELVSKCDRLADHYAGQLIAKHWPTIRSALTSQASPSSLPVAGADIAQLEAIVAKMTPGPWKDCRDAASALSGDAKMSGLHWAANLDDGENGGGIAIWWGPLIDGLLGSDDTPTTREEDVVGCIAIRNAAPALLAELSTLRTSTARLAAEVERLRKAANEMHEAHHALHGCDECNLCALLAPAAATKETT